jgi:hypothetical protein
MMLPPTLQNSILPAAVYSVFLECLPLYETTCEALERHWDLNSTQINRLGITSCPTAIGNILASAECEERFRNRLVQVPGFFCYDRLPCVCDSCEFCQFHWTEYCICARRVWLADLDPRLARHGIIVPERNNRGWISRLWIYRHVRDQSPFPLTVRTKKVAA